MPSETSLSFVVTANAEQFESVMQKVATRTQTFEKQQSAVSAAVTTSSKRSQMALIEIGRGAEDFMAGFSTGGIAGGMRGIMNNLGQLATILSPATAGFVMLGGAIATAALPSLLRWASATEDAEKAQKKLDDALEASRERVKKYNDGLKERLDLEQELRRIPFGGKSSEELRGQLEGGDEELRRMRIERERRRLSILTGRERLRSTQDSLSAGGLIDTSAFRERMPNDVELQLMAQAKNPNAFAYGRAPNAREGVPTVQELAALRKSAAADIEKFRTMTAAIEEQSKAQAQTQQQITAEEARQQERQREHDRVFRDEQRRFATEFTGGMSSGAAGDADFRQIQDSARERMLKMEAERTRVLEDAEESLRSMTTQREMAAQNLDDMILGDGGSRFNPRTGKQEDTATELERRQQQETLNRLDRQIRLQEQTLQELRSSRRDPYPEFTAVSE